MAVRETPMAGRNALRRRLISLAVASALAGWGGGAQANPVVNTPGAVINWQQFSIQKDEITRFLQQNAASAVLNRVRGGDPSVILGQLLSNGRVFLINPSGIAIGKGAVIDVAGFAASTLNISDADWISGKLRFEGTGLEGKLENAGTIKTAQGGHVYLIAPKVENKPDGVIQSPQGEVIVAAGKTVELVNAGTPDIRVEYTAPDNSAVNAGRIVAAGGRVGIYGTLVKNSGLVSATHAEVGKGGKIVFRATKDVELDPGSKVEANGTQGGEITVQADSGAIRAQGTIEANGTETGGLVALRAAQAIDVPAGAAVRATGAGGKVELVAKNAEAAPTEVHIGGKIEAGATVSIDAPQGRTQLDSGAVISAPEIQVASKVFAGEGALDASGAQGGRVEIEVDSIDWAGSVFAAGTLSDGGVVHVVAQDSVEIAPSSIVRVDGAQRGGEVSIRAVETEVLLAGTVSARGLTTGGEITVTAPKVETQDAVLDASGALGGGRVRLGGDYQGNGDLPQARQTYVDLYTRIRADAETEGDGGTIVVWSTDLTWFAGTASVRGGAVSGDGGLVETSSKGALSVTGRVDASAPNGQLGIFLLWWRGGDDRRGSVRGRRHECHDRPGNA
ncbi:MAG: filamentous hemagglutinin N-terminal domain-containing protein [Alphaproteobacteria bacterium]